MSDSPAAVVEQIMREERAITERAFRLASTLNDEAKADALEHERLQARFVGAGIFQRPS